MHTHATCKLTFSMLIRNVFPSSSSHVVSSSLISCNNSSSNIGGCPFIPTQICFFFKFTITSRGLSLNAALDGILSYGKKFTKFIKNSSYNIINMYKSYDS